MLPRHQGHPFPRFFYGYGRTNPLCKFRHGLTATESGGPYLDGSEAEKDALRALVPSYTAAIASRALKKSKIPKKDKGKGKESKAIAASIPSRTIGSVTGSALFAGIIPTPRPGLHIGGTVLYKA